MRITVKCDSCKEELHIREASLNPCDELEIFVTPCGEIDCYGGSEIMDLRAQISELERRLEEADTTIAGIKAILQR